MVHKPERRYLYLAILLIALSVAQLLYRLSLPGDGWSYTRDVTGSGMRLVLDRNLSGRPSPLKSGDVLEWVHGQSVDGMVARALALSPLRPEDWAVGRSAPYIVLRHDDEVSVAVRLERLPARAVLRNALRSLLLSPGPLLMLLIAFFVFFRDSRSRSSQLLLLFSAAVFASDGVSQVVTGTNVPGPAEMFYPGAYWPAQIMNALIWPLLIAPLFLHLLLSFRATRARFRRYRRLGLQFIYALGPVVTLLLWLANPGQPLDFWRAWNTFSLIDFVGALLAAIAIMVYTVAAARDPASRAQATWVAAGTILTSLGALSGSGVILLGLSEFPFWLAWTATRLLLLGFPICVAIAILRYRLFDIDVIVHNTVVYAVLSGLLAGIYVVSVIALQSIFRGLTGERSPVAVVLSTLAIAALFVPLRRRVQQVIDRRMYHHRYDTERIVAAFSATLRNEVDLKRLSSRLIHVTEETMQAKEVSLWLRKDVR